MAPGRGQRNGSPAGSDGSLFRFPCETVVRVGAGRAQRPAALRPARFADLLRPASTETCCVRPASIMPRGYRPMANGKAILDEVRPPTDLGDYRKKHWDGTFEEYLDIVSRPPR